MKDSDAWVVEVCRRFGWTEEAVRKAFADELEGRRGPDDPLEVPDRMVIDYRWSCGGVSPFFRALRDDGRILGSACPSCGKVWLPPRTTCSDCFVETAWKPVGPGGRVVAATSVHFATSAFFRQVPFVCAYIHLDGADTAIMANITGMTLEEARPGARVRAEFRELRMGSMGDFWFVPE